MRQSFEVGGSNRGHSPGSSVRARVAAAPLPVDVQLTQCQQFDRATKRTEDLDRARETESIRLKEAQERLCCLQEEVAVRASAVWVGKASHPGPQEARESTDDELPLLRDRNVILLCVWARDVTCSVASTQVDREEATTPSHGVEHTPVGIPMEFSPICCLEVHTSDRRRTARPVEGQDVVQRTGPIQVDSNSDASPVDKAFLDALEEDLSLKGRLRQAARVALEVRHSAECHEGSLEGRER